MNENKPQITSESNDPVRHAVMLATRRLRQRRTLRLAATGLLVGSSIGFVVAALMNFGVVQETSLPGYGGFLFIPSLGGLVIGGLMGAVGKYETVSVARLLERRLDLKDRLSTALGASTDHPLTKAQLADAARNAPGDADVFRAVPLTPVPRRVYVAAAVSLAVLLTYFGPQLPVFWNPARRAEQVAVKKEGERLLKIAKAASDEARKQKLPEAEKAAQKVEKLGSEMARGRMRLKEALVQRAKLNEELRKAQDKVALDQMKRSEQETQKKLTATGRDLGKNLSNNKSEPGTETAGATPDGRMKSLLDALARGDKRAVAQALREMADAADQGDPKTAAERGKMGRQLDALGDALNKNNLKDAGSSAQNASDSLQRNDMPSTARSLREAADRIERSADAAQNAAKQNAGGNQSGQSGSRSQGQSGAQREQSLMDKIQSAINSLTGQGQQGTQSGQQSSSQSGQQSQGQQGQQGQQSSGSQSQSGQSSQQGSSSQSNGSQNNGSQSQSGQQNSNRQNGQGQSGQQGSGSQSKSGSSGQNGKQGSGNNGASGQGQGKSGQGNNGNRNGSSSGAGSGSTGSAKNGSSSARIGKNAVEQNVRTKRSGDGPETIVTENDNDRSALPASSLPYYNEFVTKRRTPAGEAAQGGDNVPSAYKNQVRGYFDGLPQATQPNPKGQ